MRAKAWQAIPGVTKWVMGIIKRGCVLLFAQRILLFNGMVPTSMKSEGIHVLRSEVNNMVLWFFSLDLNPDSPPITGAS